MGLSDHELIYCSRKESLLKSNVHNEISIKSVKHYSDEIFVEKLRSIKFPGYSNHTCMNDARQDFITKFLSVVDSVTPVKICLLLLLLSFYFQSTKSVIICLVKNYITLAKANCRC